MHLLFITDTDILAGISSACEVCGASFTYVLWAYIYTLFNTGKVVLHGCVISALGCSDHRLQGVIFIQNTVLNDYRCLVVANVE